MSEHTVEFLFKVTEVQPEDVVSVVVIVGDPETAPVSEELGELTMLKHQWELLKTMLVDGQGRYQDEEICLVFENRIMGLRGVEWVE